ncbi:MAG TPA: GspH/FimT family pseudopilin [Paucimonas sp.]|nr:GspH/FimT family pseudopilin [Paucimonas sp.]
MLILRRHGGVTLVELMIAVAVMSLLLAAGVPSFSLWLQNLQTRTAAESIQSGLHMALTEAVRRNAYVRFELTDATGKVAWKVGCVTVKADCPAVLQSRESKEGGGNARVGISTDEIPNPVPAAQFATAITPGTGLPAGVTFDGFGRVVNIGDDVTRIDVTNAANSDVRRLVVTIGTIGQIRMCDPAQSYATNPQGC